MCESRSCHTPIPVIASAARQSRAALANNTGLLRYARNDGFHHVSRRNWDEEVADVHFLLIAIARVSVGKFVALYPVHTPPITKLTIDSSNKIAPTALAR